VSCGPDCKEIFAVEPDLGEIVVIDAAALGVVRRARVCARPEQVVAGPKGGAFVSCRGDGTLVALAPDLAVAGRREVGAEPFGIALSAEGETLLVTTAAEPALTALAADDLAERWRLDLPAEPRGVGVTPDGRRAVVGHLVGEGVSVVDLQTRKRVAATLPTMRDGWMNELMSQFDRGDKPAVRRVPGGAYAVAMSPGGTRAFAPYVLRNNGEKLENLVPGCYANGAQVPLAASVAAVDVSGVLMHVQRPVPHALPAGTRGPTVSLSKLSMMGRLGVVRAAVHDPKHARLFVVGEGSSLLATFDTSVADPTTTPLAFVKLRGPARGIAVDAAGERVFVHLGLDHEIAVVDLTQPHVEPRHVVIGGEQLPPPVARGRKLFHTANEGHVAGITGVACASCHLEGRSDGVTWRLDDKPLQTPMLAGRLSGRGALRWGGESPSLEHAVAEAVKRLRGSGLGAADAAALAAYLRSGQAEMAAPASPHAPDARGRVLFAEAGCANCHRPDSAFSDGKLHAFRGGRYRTPSLRGLFATAPYYHDGSAPTLRALLGTHEAGNPMAVGARLAPPDLAALESFLRSL
jgi:mono/diheme cytochrome c family protein